ncbi:30S ribosomal protein S4e [Halobellus sp. GM3]|uniref:30S ribosomal protein S4e n=1 Tax=Halobellus sp. GM3 TaxID=3458410 RepID=UPI00403DC3CB
MTRHQKRLSAPNAWPVERKTATFTVKAGAGPHGEAGVPLLILLRDVLGYVDSKKEARYALNEGTVLVNGDAVSDEQRPVGMFDILAFTEREEYYRVFPEEGGRLALTPVDADAAGSRLGKIVGKRDVTGGATQLTLHDGTNVRVDDGGEYGTKDSLVIDNETKEIVAHFPYGEGALVTAVDGTHSGEIGEIDEITVTAGSGDNTVAVTHDDGSFETVEQYVVVIDEKFVDDDGDSADEESSESTTDETDEADAEAVDDSDDGGDDE